MRPSVLTHLTYRRIRYDFYGNIVYQNLNALKQAVIAAGADIDDIDAYRQAITNALG